MNKLSGEIMKAIRTQIESHSNLTALCPSSSGWRAMHRSLAGGNGHAIAMLPARLTLGQCAPKLNGFACEKRRKSRQWDDRGKRPPLDVYLLNDAAPTALRQRIASGLA